MKTILEVVGMAAALAAFMGWIMSCFKMFLDCDYRQHPLASFGWILALFLSVGIVAARAEMSKRDDYKKQEPQP